VGDGDSIFSADDFSEDQLRRYARHIVLREVGGAGQARLLNARVLVVGAGGLGSPLLLYLAAAGVGTLGVIDDDVVDLSNLQRQVLHTTVDLGMDKVKSAEKAVAAVNPSIRLVPHKARLNSKNIQGLLKDYDIVADGSDNFATRYLVNDACHLAGRPLVSAALLRFDAQISTFKSYRGGDNPCYRCIFREPPAPGLVPSCAEGGVLGVVAGVAGSLQATEVIKEILGIGAGLSGWMIIYDALDGTVHKIRIKPDPECPLCGKTPTIGNLSAHD
jgi:adenylyltransferase/sulfurtransferase|tara:strand:+ start:755 stop:1576 length:822 start_codon:yes stop_codon:yes gene_type:complete